jgi:hypothetical protein
MVHLLVDKKKKALESAFDQVAATHRLRSGRSGRTSSASFQLILI